MNLIIFLLVLAFIVAIHEFGHLLAAKSFGVYCYEYAINQEAILKYDQYSYDNELIFDRHQKCDVERIFK